jgi:hypothetical protein
MMSLFKGDPSAALAKTQDRIASVESNLADMALKRRERLLTAEDPVEVAALDKAIEAETANLAILHDRIKALRPMSMAEAADRKSAFLADKTTKAALMAGSANETAEWRLITENLYQAPEITQPRDEVTEHLNASSGYTLPDDVLQEFRENKPVTPNEYRMARARFEARIQDPAWQTKINRGDPEARKELALIQSILSRPIRSPQSQP